MHCTGSVLTICYICLLIYPYKCGSVYILLCRYIVYLMPKLKMELYIDSRFNLIWFKCWELSVWSQISRNAWRRTWCGVQDECPGIKHCSCGRCHSGVGCCWSSGALSIAGGSKRGSTEREKRLMSILCVHYESSRVEYMTAEPNDCILIAQPGGAGYTQRSWAYTILRTRRQLSAHWGRSNVA